MHSPYGGSLTERDKISEWHRFVLSKLFLVKGSEGSASDTWTFSPKRFIGLPSLLQKAIEIIFESRANLHDNLSLLR